MNDADLRVGLGKLLNTEVGPALARRIEGGCINDCYRYETALGPVFVKVAGVDRIAMFEAEAAGLEELRSAHSVRVPTVLGSGAVGESAFLALEWIDLAHRTTTTDRALGEQLAQQHRVNKPLYGWKRANFIGSTPQINFWSNDWLNFWRSHRFEAQLDLAAQNGADASFMERTTLLCALMDGFLTLHKPVASLLHGDLWSGNYAADTSGAPVIFDPAVYFGDRECDLAMTRLFGAFGREFYAAYENAWPLDTGWQQRVELYNLYHVLNHFNLFGGGYLSQAEAMVQRLLAELGH